MKIVLDTNVFVSGLFFTGPPYQIRVLKPRQFVEEHLKKRFQRELVRGVRRIAGSGGVENVFDGDAEP